jgi:hypothetical protein
MKRVACTIGFVALAWGAAFAQTAPPAAPAADKAAVTDKAAAEKTLIALENRLNDAIARGDKATFQLLVAPDAVSADKGGFLPTSQFLQVFDRLKVKEWKIVNPQVLWVDATSAIVTYSWTGSGTFMDQPLDPMVLASTVWTKRGTRWLAVYHQETAKAK